MCVLSVIGRRVIYEIRPFYGGKPKYIQVCISSQVYSESYLILNFCCIPMQWAPCSFLWITLRLLTRKIVRNRSSRPRVHCDHSHHGKLTLTLCSALRNGGLKSHIFIEITLLDEDEMSVGGKHVRARLVGWRQYWCEGNNFKLGIDWLREDKDLNKLETDFQFFTSQTLMSSENQLEPQVSWWRGN